MTTVVRSQARGLPSIDLPRATASHSDATAIAALPAAVAMTRGVGRGPLRIPPKTTNRLQVTATAAVNNPSSLNRT
jgi:hypothetical protein